MKSQYLFLFLLFLQACLSDEDECRYKEFNDLLPPVGLYSVDSFHVFVHDSVSGYYFDTVYLNDGNLELVTNRDSNCYEKGTILFRRANGNQEILSYGFSSYGPSYLTDISLNGPSLDGYSAGFIETMEFTRAENTVSIFTSGRSRSYTKYWHPKMIRYWEFKLTKLP